MKQFFIKLRGIISFFLAVIMSILGIYMPSRGTKDHIEDGEIRIMSFNVRCAEFLERGEIVPLLIGEYLPDSVGLQECTYDWYNTFRYLLPEYQFVGVGRDTGDISEDCGEISAVLFRKDKYTLEDSGTFWLSETPDEVSRGWDAACNRICTYVVLKDKETGETYAHVNTHLDHMGIFARKNGVDLVTQKALSFDIPTVLTGDFNFKKDTDLYKQLVGSGLRDSQDLATETMTGKTYHGYRGGEEGKPIDYILVNAKIESVSRYKIVREQINDLYTSDHYPIYADITF